jgi:hypothetical protein
LCIDLGDVEVQELILLLENDDKEDADDVEDDQDK